MSIVSYIEDCVLSHIQRRCDHPGQMVAADVLEGCSVDYEVQYCRRCGAIKIVRVSVTGKRKEHEWRIPLPHLWRGK